MVNRILQVLLALALGVVLFFGVTPKIIGLGIQDATVANLINIIPPETQGQITFRESRFDNGWFQSRATVDIVWTPLGVDEALTMQLNFDIEHGPFFLTDDGPKIGLAYGQIEPSFNSPELTEAMTMIPFELPSVDISLFVPFGESMNIDLAISPVNYDMNGTVVNFGGLDASLLVNADQSANMNLSMGPFFAQNSGSEIGVTIAGMEIQSQTTQMNDILAPSSMVLTMPSVSATGPIPFSVTGISSNSRLQASAVANAIDISQVFQVSNIESDLPLQSLSWTSELNEVQEEFFRNYYGLVSQIQSQMNSNPNAVLSDMNQFGEDMALSLIQNSLVLNNIVRANVFGGDHSLDLFIDWEGLPDRSNLDNPEPEEILNAVAINLDLSLDQAAIMGSQFAELVDPYVQQGYLTVDNGRIVLNASLTAGTLTVNGEEVPLEQFF